MAAIAIIGAGLTGLAAAYSLKQRGNRVVVYEAADRAGGSGAYRTPLRLPGRARAQLDVSADAGGG